MLRRRIVPLAALAVVVVGASVAFAGPSGPIEPPGASVSEQAVRIDPPTPDDVVSIYNSGQLRTDVRDRALAAARDAGASATVRQAATLGMRSVVRDGSPVQTAPAGYQYPMGTSVLDPVAVRDLMGGDVAAAMSSSDRIVMSRLTASLRGAEAGDIVTLVAANASPVQFEIGAVVDDAITGGTELLISPGAAARVGLQRESSVVVWGFTERSDIDAALANNGLVSTSIRIRRSWDPFDPDATIGMAETKALLGEFAYQLGSGGGVSIDPAWTSANLPGGRVLLNNSIPIRARCHDVVEPAIRAALAEVAAAGLGGTINVTHANTAGGCYVPRFSRVANSAIGFLSRHTWGQAIDTNTVGSCLGCAPPDFATNPGGCRTVQIFRKHGFAWGGNFLTPDGMHFEYVGEPRDGFAYPSRYCANDVSTSSFTGDGATMRPVIFSDAELIDSHDH